MVDGAVSGLARLTNGTGKLAQKAQSGNLQTYLLFFAAGIVFILLIMLLAG